MTPETTTLQALTTPCQGCTHSEICEMGMACLDYEKWHQTGLIRYEHRAPSRAIYRRVFSTDDEVM